MKLNLMNNCFGEDTGHNLYKQIFPKINNGEKVMIDFENVTDTDATFLFHAFGKLYETIPIITVREKLISVFSPNNKHIELLFRNVMTYSEIFFYDSRFRNDALNFVQQNQNKN